MALKERIYSSESELFSLRVDSFLEKFIVQESIEYDTKVSPLSKGGEKHGGAPIHLQLRNLRAVSGNSYQQFIIQNLILGGEKQQQQKNV